MSIRWRAFWALMLYVTLCSVAIGLLFSRPLTSAHESVALICLLTAQIIAAYLLMLTKDNH